MRAGLANRPVPYTPRPGPPGVREPLEEHGPMLQSFVTLSRREPSLMVSPMAVYSSRSSEPMVLIELARGYA